MSIAGLSWQTWTMRLVAGLSQKADPRSLESPELARLVDGQFDEVGGIQTRYPYAALGSNILDGGTITNARKFYDNGGELVLFTKDALYSWNAQLSKWARKGTHLAVSIEEENRVVTTGDQVECDRAELNNLIVYAWRDGTEIYCAAIDKTTGAVVVAPIAMGQGDSVSRPRLVALQTRIVMVYTNITQGLLYGESFDPADPVGTISPSVSTTPIGAASGHDLYFDAVAQPGADVVITVQRLTPATSYTIGKWNALTFASTISTKARTCDGPIACSISPGGTYLQVVRANAANLQGDLINVATLADVYTAQAIGTIDTGVSTRVQIACAHRSVQDSGQYRCYVFWSSNSTSDNGSFDWQTKMNWVDTGNTLGTAAAFLHRMEPASRAFDHEGRIFLWMLWGQNAGEFGTIANIGQLQNASFLYRDDGFLCAKSATNKGSGFLTVGHLPGVANVGGSSYAYCGTERTIFDYVSFVANNFVGRRQRDVVFTFDSNEARRCARLGKTLYIAAGEVLQYDGVQLTEVGFHVWPYFHTFLVAAGAAGSIEIGNYTYKMSFRWLNARGEIDRSTSIWAYTLFASAADRRVVIDKINPLHTTHKIATAPAVEVWRTLKNPTDDAPFYRVSAGDPNDSTNPNRYLSNAAAVDWLPTFHDEMIDATAATQAGHHEDGGQIETLAPPAASIIIASDTRLFLAGVAGDPDRVWYSKLRGDGEVASFNDALTANVPVVGGDITALAFLQETLVVFREHAVYVLPNQGYGNTGLGENYGPARTLSEDIGAVSQESVAVIDRGVIFKSAKGWYLINRGWAIEYIGGPVSDYDSETPLSVEVVQSQHQVRVLTASRMLVFDTLVGQWAEWSIAGAVHACMWNGVHAYLTSTGPRTQQTAYTGVDYGLDLETAWIKLNDLQGYGAIDALDVLGEYRSACNVRLRLARDYWRDGVDTYFQDKTHTPALTAGRPFELRHRPSIRQVKALKVRITVSPTAAGESLKLTGFAFSLGVQPGLSRNVAQAAKQ